VLIILKAKISPPSVLSQPSNPSMMNPSKSFNVACSHGHLQNLKPKAFSSSSLTMDSFTNLPMNPNTYSPTLFTSHQPMDNTKDLMKQDFNQLPINNVPKQAARKNPKVRNHSMTMPIQPLSTKPLKVQLSTSTQSQVNSSPHSLQQSPSPSMCPTSSGRTPARRTTSSTPPSSPPGFSVPPAQVFLMTKDFTLTLEEFQILMKIVND
jgi:hypothetical protein